MLYTGELTISGDHPKDMRYKKVRKRPCHHQEKVCISFIHSPEFQLLGERLSRRQTGCRFNPSGFRRLQRLFRLIRTVGQVLGQLAVICRLFDHEESENEKGDSKGELDVEEQSPGLAAVEHIPSEKGTSGAEAQSDYIWQRKLALDDLGDTMIRNVYVTCD